MSFSAWLRKLFFPAARGSEKPGSSYSTDPAAQTVRKDSFASLCELTRLSSDSPGAADAACDDTTDILLAIGNRFREQGDIAKAVRLRENLLSLSDSPQNSGKILFELGRDYRKAGFLDRALSSFKDAKKHGFHERKISQELALIYADSGDFAAAAAQFAVLEMPWAEACFLVRQAEESADTGLDDKAYRLLKRALECFDSSPEAWLALAVMSLAGGNASKSVEHAASGLTGGSASTRLILLEGLHAFLKGPARPGISAPILAAFAKGIDKCVAKLELDAVMSYYTGLFMQAAGSSDGAEQCFTKSLIVDPDFWAARLGILTIAAEREKLPSLLSQQIAFFTQQGAQSKRFYCRPCGMRRDSVFSFCPRCQAWHSVAFRMRLT
ncbi:hypothetical protein LJC59_06380 [Desulfovibrio sp. OttesenSCG-928-A18]|nr:hypothetical protein [Desulfovibrio sp. OttesenSCG-928-A18]